jgi:hypothetical protein
MLVFVCLGAEDHVWALLAFFKGARYPVVAANATGQDQRFWHVVCLLEAIGQILPGNARSIA